MVITMTSSIKFFIVLTLTGINCKKIGNFLCDYTNKSGIQWCYFKNYKYSSQLNFSDVVANRNKVDSMFLDLRSVQTENLLEQIFLKYKYLETLTIMSSTNLKILESSFENAFELTYLSISSNKIRKLEGTPFKNTKKLKTLVAISNLIEKIDSNLFKGPTSLTNINLSSNNIKFIETGTFYDLNLEELHLTDNKLVEFDFRNLNVISLQLDRNLLMELLEKDFNSSGFDLEKLSLNKNNLTKLNNKLFENFKEITLFDASYNLIEHISSDVFQGLYNLSELILTGNKIKSIEKGAFYNLTLDTIRLNKNQLTEFNFEFLSVYILQLQNNHLTQILINGNIKKLYLNQNNLSLIEIETRTLTELLTTANNKNLRIQYV